MASESNNSGRQFHSKR